jgi:hypothetical protein
VTRPRPELGRGATVFVYAPRSCDQLALLLSLCFRVLENLMFPSPRSLHRDTWPGTVFALLAMAEIRSERFAYENPQASTPRASEETPPAQPPLQFPCSETQRYRQCILRPLWTSTVPLPMAPPLLRDVINSRVVVRLAAYAAASKGAATTFDYNSLDGCLWRTPTF